MEPVMVTELKLDRLSYGRMYTKWNEVHRGQADFVSGQYVNGDLCFDVLDEYGTRKSLQIPDGARINKVGGTGDSLLLRFVTDDRVITVDRDGDVIVK